MLESIYKKLISFSEYDDVHYSFWGNDSLDSFYLNFDYDIHRHRFESAQELNETALSVFLILGPLNLKQQKKLLDSISSVDVKKRLIIRFKGSLSHEILTRSYLKFSEERLKEVVDLNIQKYPYDLDEIIENIREEVGKKINDN